MVMFCIQRLVVDCIVLLCVRLGSFHCYRLKEPILEILYRAKMVFMRSAITLPKVNRFG